MPADGAWGKWTKRNACLVATIAFGLAAFATWVTTGETLYGELWALEMSLHFAFGIAMATLGMPWALGLLAGFGFRFAIAVVRFGWLTAGRPAAPDDAVWGLGLPTIFGAGEWFVAFVGVVFGLAASGAARPRA